MKKQIVYVILITLLICIAGCGKKADSSTENTGDSEIYDVKDTGSEKAGESDEKDLTDDSKGILPEYYATYADLLYQFMNGEDAYFMSNDNAISYNSDQPALSYSQEFVFGLYDLGSDGREELIVAEGKSFENGGIANILVPKEKWKDANLGEVSYVDAQNAKMASVISDNDDTVSYYELKGDELIPYDEYYHQWYDLTENDTFISNDSYYHVTKEKEPITEEEYNNQDAFHWNPVDIPFYHLSETNIDFILKGTIADEKNTNWKQAYMPIVKQWDIMHSNDYSYGYSIEYIDSKGERVTKEAGTDDDGKYYEIEGAPEAEEIEKIYNIDFDKVKSFNGNMNYKAICSLLDMD